MDKESMDTKSVDTILFDLDGTLLPMDQDKFVKNYFHRLAGKGADIGLDPDVLIKSVWAGTMAMIQNDGSVTNRDRFWSVFFELTHGEREQLEPVFERFYQNEFQYVKSVTEPTPNALTWVTCLKEKGYQLVLATNPIFPAVATHARIRWAGLDPSDFIWITTYENSSYSKPNPEYYRAILREIGKDPTGCLMVGNDVREDMCVEKLGMDCYLLTECLISDANEDWTRFAHGNSAQLTAYFASLPDVRHI